MKFSRENYLKRIMDDEFKTYLEAFGAVCVEGPKGCGKTWFSLNNSKSAFMLADPKNNFMNRRLAEVDINIIFEGERPHLIDEWQDIPERWDATILTVVGNSYSQVHRHRISKASDIVEQGGSVFSNYVRCHCMNPAILQERSL